MSHVQIRIGIWQCLRWWVVGHSLIWICSCFWNRRKIWARNWELVSSWGAVKKRWTHELHALSVVLRLVEGGTGRRDKEVRGNKGGWYINRWRIASTAQIWMSRWHRAYITLIFDFLLRNWQITRRPISKFTEEGVIRFVLRKMIKCRWLVTNRVAILSWRYSVLGWRGL